MKVKIYPTMVSSSSSALIVIAPLLLMAYCFFDFVAAFPGESPDQLWLKKKMEFLRPSPSLTRRLTAISLTPAPGGSFPLQKGQASRILYVTAYGADPTGKTDSTDALLRAISDAFRPQNSHRLMPGIPDLGGAQIHLEGGSYLISRPLRLPASGGGNLMIHSGSLRSTDDFPSDRHLIELWPESVPKLDTRNGDAAKAYGAPSGATFLYENIRLKDLLLDANFRGGGIALINSLRTTIDNCYITHFSTDAILVQGGHESYIHNSFLGQHIT
ncbi:polygalacturonase QRT3, partial [Amborella trichopoda]|uniref:polygalacturonase QRT3 n=1 Tax=Amborella trichopoda TaxID=13333 RepID=UPI0009C0F213